METSYRYALSVTSQFPFCSVPLRLDAYSKCQFSCRYCFAAARGGSRPLGKMQSASPQKIERLLQAAGRGEGGVLGEMIRAQVPIHFGGMADPFPKIEDKLGVALDLLHILAKYKYPTIISAKGVPAEVERYADVLSAGRMMVQFSFAVVKPESAKHVDAGVPLLAKRLKFMSLLSSSGVPVALRLQPVFPGHEKHAELLMRLAASAGARHVAVEFLKCPVEANWRGGRFLVADSKGVQQTFAELGAERLGREWILPVSYRSVRALRMKRVAREVGMTFAFADNDLLHFSDGEACCTASDIYLGASGMGFNFHRAVKRADPSGIVSFASIENEWRPAGSIAQYLNSHSRARGKTLDDQVLAGWNQSLYSPSSFYGVSDSGDSDDLGRKIYLLDNKLRTRFGAGASEGGG